MAMDVGGHQMDACEGVCGHLESNIEGALIVEINIKVSIPLSPTHLDSSFAILESRLVPSASTFAALARNIAGRQLFKLSAALRRAVCLFRVMAQALVMAGCMESGLTNPTH